MANDPTVAARVAQKYPLPLPGVYPFWILFPGGTIAQTDVAGEPFELQTYGVICRYIVGKVGDNYEGVNFSKLWVYLPAVINFLGSHRDLIFQEGQDPIEELQPEGITIGTASRFGVFRDDPDHLGFELPIVLTFHVDNPTVYF